MLQKTPPCRLNRPFQLSLIFLRETEDEFLTVNDLTESNLMKSFHCTIHVFTEVVFYIKAIIMLPPKDFKANLFMASDGVGRLVPLLSLLLMYFSFGEILSVVLSVHHALLLKHEVKILFLYHKKVISGLKPEMSSFYFFFFKLR